MPNTKGFACTDAFNGTWYSPVGGGFQHSPWAQEETEARREDVPSWDLPSQEVADSGFNPVQDSSAAPLKNQKGAM